MKKTISLLLALIFISALFSGCGKKEVVIRTIDIGVIEPLTGDYSLGGNRELLGIEYARAVRQSATIDGNEYIVNLVTKDCETSVAESVYVARELAEQNVAIVLGSYNSSYCNVAASELESVGISAVAITANDPTVTTTHSNYYRVCYLNEMEGKMLAQYAYNTGHRTAYCIAQSDLTYDREMCNYFIDEFTALGGSVITSVTEILYNTYTTSLTNLNDYINGAILYKADIMFAPIPTQWGAMLIEGSAAAGVRYDILGDDFWNVAEIGEAGIQTYLNIHCATSFVEDLNEQTKNFAEDFRDWLNADPARIEANGGTDDIYPASALAYDAYNVAIEAIEKANSTDPHDVSEAIKQVTWDGVTGFIAFDEKGDLTRKEIMINAVDDNTGNIYYRRTESAVAYASDRATE